jgi:thioredoxin reductase (NADPH)
MQLRTALGRFSHALKKSQDWSFMTEPHRPVVLAVDDDPHVLRAIRRDLNRVYQDRYRVLALTSPVEGLRVLDTLRERQEEPALLLVDQRMPEMQGIDFLAESRDRFPAARRVLLTAYADTSVAIAAINQVSLDHYLVKPWEPPSERLYPVLDELLADWQASYRPPYRGIKLIGHRLSPATHRMRDFLTRHQLPFRFVDIDRDAVPEGVAARPDELPIVVLPDGTRLARPSHADLGAALGASDVADQPYYDVAIVGGGPAGLAASVYAASEGLSTVLLDSYVPGGQAGTTSRIDNYLGFPAGVSGGDLARRAVAQARRFGAELLSPVTAVGLRRAGRARVLALSDGGEIAAGSVLLATGLSYRRLDALGADRFECAGIYYGATISETASCRGRDVWIVGGGNSAGQAAIHFAQHAARVTMLVRADCLERTMSRYLMEEIRRTPNIDVRLRARLVAADGAERLEQITVEDLDGGGITTENAEYVFTFIGARPRTEWLADVVVRDDAGFLLTGPDLGRADGLPDWDLPREPFLLETSVPGVFAAGDARAGSVKRLASGVGEGAMAVTSLHRYRAEG